MIKKELKNIFIIGILFSTLFAFLLHTTTATTSGVSGAANLTIWDNTDAEGGGENRFSNINITFFANLTNTTQFILNTTVANCTIRLNYTGIYGSFFNMSFNVSRSLWLYNTLVNYKGTHQFQVNCSSIYGNVTVTDNFIITNTAPSISKDQGGSFIDLDGNTLNNDYLYCTEDQLCTYNFSANVTEIDVNDVLTFNYTQSNTSLTNFTLNASTGILLINYTTDADVNLVSGNKQIVLAVRDTESTTQEGILRVNVTSENDPPLFINLGGARVINESGINLILAAVDEENDLNYTFNVSFMSCTHAALNPPTGANNCSLFNLTAYNASATNITFIPQGNQKGEYEINFTVKDARNATYAQVVNWTISWNDAPYFKYVCDNQRNATEDATFLCYINASDPDELYNLTFSVNYTWFTFNASATNGTTISTGSTGNASALVNFTATDTEVGNWSVNVTVTDTGAASSTSKSNSTVFYFFVANRNDSVSISDIPNITAYTSENYSITVNGTDNDLLISNKLVYNETLTFTSNNSNVAVSASTPVAGTNVSQATISFDPNILGIGNHTINITVRDKYNYSVASDVFTIFVSGNTAPAWQNPGRNHNLTENVTFYLNLSRNVTDTDDINFSYILLDGFDFDSFSINTDTGIINFTPIDQDVGTHEVRITATDGKTPSTLDFNFTVYNRNDNVTFFQIQAQTPNASISGSNITTQEDNYTILYFFIADDDLLVPTDQSSFYAESHTINTTLVGPNTTLFQFGSGTDGILSLYQWSATFTPAKGDVGNYTLTVNVTDSANSSVQRSYNLTIIQTLHPPNITSNVSNQVFSVANENFYFDINATDLEDGSDGVPTNLTFRLQNLTAGGNFLTINRSTGVINFTFNQSHAGIWRYNLTVNDTHNHLAFVYFNVTVYDYPTILLPNSSYVFRFVENSSLVFNITANHTVQDALNFTLTINSVYKNSTIGPGNVTNLSWAYTPNFTEETTCSGLINITINVSNSKLSNTTSWLAEINHTNAPLTFLSNVPDQSGGSPLTIFLSNYFYDLDAADECVNQTIGFIATPQNGSGSSISVSITNWTNDTTASAIFSSSVDASANYSFAAFEYNSSNNSQLIGNVSSNNFTVSLTVSTTTNTQSNGGGGGGGSATTRVVSLKIIVPEPVSAKQKDKLVIPLKLQNDGTIDLQGILLSAQIAKDGALRSDLVASFDKTFFDKLEVGTQEDVTLIVDIDTESTGLFEVTINGTVEDPVYSDWAKLYIEIDEDRSVLERIVFTEEFIIGNPQCAELVDVINDAKEIFTQGKVKEALAKAESVLEECKQAISQPPRPRLYARLGDKFIGYTAIASLVAFVLGFGYYTFKKIRLKQQITRPEEKFNNPRRFMQ